MSAPAVAASGAFPTTAARRPRRVLGWVALVVAIVLVAGVGALIAFDGWRDRGALDPESAGPEGTRAVVRLLQEQGVRVTVARDRTAAEDALADGPSTLALPDAPMLSDAALAELAGAADDVVLIEPRSRSLDVLLEGSALGGFAADESGPPSCELPAAVAAGTTRTGELYLPGEGVQGCYRADGGFGVLVAGSEGRRTTALDGLSVLTNTALPLDGNAALALGVLGTRPHLVWYVPSLSDADATTEPPTIGDLTPPWVTPALVLLLVSAAAAAAWRGRRFGPLVAERLPVTVRAGETTAGRARLYAASRDTAHAIATLRRATRSRLARTLGMPPAAAPERIADAVAERLAADRAVVRGILIDSAPRDDRELVEASDRLRELEASVRAAVRTERNPR